MLFEILLPLLLLMGCGCAFLLASVFVGANRWWGPFTVLAVATAAWSLSRVTPTPPEISAASEFPAVILDGFGFAVQWGSLIIGFFFAFAALKIQERNPAAGGVFGSMLLSLSGVMLAGIANDLVVMFAAVSLAVLPIAITILLTAVDTEGRRAGRNFLLLGLLASMLLLFGFSLIYGLAGTTNLTEAAAVFGESYLRASSEDGAATGSRLGVAGLVLTMAAAAMWVSAAPFHFGNSDVLERSSPWTAGLTAIVPKIAGLLVIIRVGLEAMVGFSETGTLIVIVLAGATMALAGIMTMSQSNLRRTLSYVAIGQIGFVLMGLAVAFWSAGPSLATSEGRGMMSGMNAALFQLAVSVASLAVVAGVLTYLERVDRRIEFIGDLKGLLRTEPAAAICLLIAFCSLVGVPPFPGFWSRLLLFLAALSVETQVVGSELPGPHFGFVVLSMLGVVSILLTSGALFRLVATMFFDVPLGRSNPIGGRCALAAAICACALLVAAGMFPGVCMMLVERFGIR